MKTYEIAAVLETDTINILSVNTYLDVKAKDFDSAKIIAQGYLGEDYTIWRVSEFEEQKRTCR